MTFNQFKQIKIGDKVKSLFSHYLWIVENINDDEIKCIFWDDFHHYSMFRSMIECPEYMK